MSGMIPAWVDGTLQPVDKLDVHRRGLRHPAVSVFLMSLGQVLLQRRAMGKYHSPGLWANTCCTHPHWGEAPLDCATRRMHQELGITELALQPAGAVEYRAEVGGGMIEHEVVDIFRADVAAPVPMMPDPAEVSETRWMSPDELARDIAARPAAYTPWLRIYVADHADRIFGPGSSISSSSNNSA